MKGKCNTFYAQGVLFILILLVVNRRFSNGFDWNPYMPSECVGGMNFSLPETAIELNISLVINAIYEISEERMEFGVQLDLYEFWHDAYLLYQRSEMGIKRAAVLLPTKIINCIWKPDTMFHNTKAEKLYENTGPNLFYKLILNRGVSSVMRKSRYKLSVACPMDFEYYPMDTQNCSIQISLFNSRKSEVLLQWADQFSNFTLLDTDTPLNYAIKRLPWTKSELQYPGVAVVIEYLHANFLFERSLSASLFNIYIPSFLVVCMSMISLYLDVNAVPGRVTLGVTSILTLSTQIVQARSGLPVLDYMTAIDVWLLGCLVIVFMTLIEFTIAHLVANAKSNQTAEKPTTSIKGTLAWTESSCFKCRYHYKPPNSKPRLDLGNKIVKRPTKCGNSVDKVSRILFPIIMLLFTCIYWMYYLKKAYSQ